MVDDTVHKTWDNSVVGAVSSGFDGLVQCLELELLRQANSAEAESADVGAMADVRVAVKAAEVVVGAAMRAADAEEEPGDRAKVIAKTNPAGSQRQSWADWSSTAGSRQSRKSLPMPSRSKNPKSSTTFLVKNSKRKS
jgi:hypothetical protein